MPRYTELRKTTSRGVLRRHIAVEGNTLFERANLGVNKKTGRISESMSTSKTAFRGEADARAAYERALARAVDDGFRGDDEPPKTTAAPPKTKRTGMPRPTPSGALTDFAHAHGHPLPPSYRAFVTKNGACDMLGGYLRIAAPGRRDARDLGRLVRLARAIAREAPDEACATFLGRAIPFADTGGAELLLWDPQDRANDPPVYFLARGADRPKKMAASFGELVKRLARDQRFVDRWFLSLDADPRIAHR